MDEPLASCMIVHFSAHISKWELVCKFGVIFHIFIISCLCSRFHVWNQWFFNSVITFSYTKCFVHSYTVDVVFTLSYREYSTAVTDKFWLTLTGPLSQIATALESTSIRHRSDPKGSIYLIDDDPRVFDIWDGFPVASMSNKSSRVTPRARFIWHQYTLNMMGSCICHRDSNSMKVSFSFNPDFGGLIANFVAICFAIKGCTGRRLRQRKWGRTKKLCKEIVTEY